MSHIINRSGAETDLFRSLSQRGINRFSSIDEMAKFKKGYLREIEDFRKKTVVEVKTEIELLSNKVASLRAEYEQRHTEQIEIVNEKISQQKAKLSGYLLMIFFSCSCINRSREAISDGDTTNTLAFNPAMKAAIRESLAYLSDSTLDLAHKDRDIINLNFSKDNDNACYLFIFAQPFYFRERAIGYALVDGYTVVFNKGDMDCVSSLVDVDKLTPVCDSIPGFINYDDFPEGIYDPYGVKYQVISPDSLLVVYKGML